jgi:hypothetical protein
MKKIRVTRIVTSISETPHNEEYYPGMSKADIIAMEKDPEQPEWQEYFFDNPKTVQTFVEFTEDEEND